MTTLFYKAGKLVSDKRVRQSATGTVSQEELKALLEREENPLGKTAISNLYTFGGYQEVYNHVETFGKVYFPKKGLNVNDETVTMVGVAGNLTTSLPLLKSLDGENIVLDEAVARFNYDIATTYGFDTLYEMIIVTKTKVHAVISGEVVTFNRDELDSSKKAVIIGCGRTIIQGWTEEIEIQHLLDGNFERVFTNKMSEDKLKQVALKDPRTGDGWVEYTC